MYCIETKDLSYRYSTTDSVLSGANLRVPEQSIYGFLGANGAGKTTTMRLLLGLLEKQSGDILILGEQPDKDRIRMLRKIGSLIEYPSFYAHLSASENLEVLNKIYQSPHSSLQRALEITGLGKTGSKPVGKFSLGMKQRLGIASSLVHEPSLLILDEPTNGLDPNGIIEIRDLFLSLNRQEGISIFISSHLLSEIELVATDVGIIHEGKLLFQDSIERMQEKAQKQITFMTSNPIKTQEILKRLDSSSKIIDQKVISGHLSNTHVAEINRILVNNDIEVYQIVADKENFEQTFMDIINNIS
ncbi:ATP-binding cassette domain-containing protein [Chryseobacterium sp. Mn2064]|uniref:ATP-binding cassette domain-containing protein n=1 Tax=Chryseobacterium sp. Mn2064 TaxID=3395263 RepID=UPI003BE1842A